MARPPGLPEAPARGPPWPAGRYYPEGGPLGQNGPVLSGSPVPGYHPPMEFLSRAWYGNPVSAWLLALGIAVGTAAVLWVIGGQLVRRLSAVASRTSTGVDDLIAEVLRRTRVLFLFLLGLRLGAWVALKLPQRLWNLLDVVTIIVAVLQVGVWGHTAIRFWTQRFREQNLAHGKASVTTVAALGLAAQILLWTAVVLVVLENLGVNITAVVAGLGITGVAVALATQSILSDLFASFAIVLDRPFVLGDFIVVDNLMGSVEQIGIKTTRVRSLSGEQIVFPNGNLIGSRIRNFGTLFERRVVLLFRVTVDTPRDRLKEIPAIVRDSVQVHPKIRFDRCHWSAMGEWSMDFETVYYVADPDFNLHMDLQQEILLRVHERFERAGIRFAVPTRVIEVSDGEAAGVPPRGPGVSPHQRLQ